MSDAQRYWGELTATALVGTGRRAALPAAPGPVADLLGGLDPAEPAAALLAAAAAATLYARAGALPPAAAAEAVPPCPDDERPPCGPRAARLLGLLLDARQRAVLPEWLAALAASGRRLPDQHLPAVLELARATPALRQAVVAVAGRRGAWLGELNPAWAFAVVGAGPPAGDEAALAELWQTGARNGRLFLLEALRAERPALARALVESTWASEKADDRAAFVAALRPGLSGADEPFLEAALDDRGKEVRANAAELLARLPDSRLAGRMTARALAHVRYTGGLFPKIEVDLPEACDKATQRDGADPRPPRGTGERAWWLHEIVARTPPAAWCAAWSLRPAAILAARTASEWRGALVKAWSAAALAYGDHEWAAALVERELDQTQHAPIAELLQILPPARREPLLIRLLDGGRSPLAGNHRALPALRLGGPWSPGLARVVIASLGRRLARLDDDARGDWHLRAALEEFALAIPPELADEAVAALPPELADNPHWAEAAQAYAGRLRLRRDMHAALRAGD